MAVVRINAPTEMKVNMVVKPPGAGESRNSTSPTVGLPSRPSTANATITATAVTVTTWAQK